MARRRWYERRQLAAPACRSSLLTAGGTGGHVFPAEALAAELLGRGFALALITDRRGQAFGGTLARLPAASHQRRRHRPAAARRAHRRAGRSRHRLPPGAAPAGAPASGGGDRLRRLCLGAGHAGRRVRRTADRAPRTERRARPRQSPAGFARHADRHLLLPECRHLNPEYRRKRYAPACRCGPR